MIYRARMQVAYCFDIKADSEEEALDWVQTHDLNDIKNATTYYDPYYDDEIIGESTEDDYVAIDISTED